MAINWKLWKLRICSLIGLVAFSGCGKPTSTPEPMVYDVTKMAYQSPEFIQNYFGNRPHSDDTGKIDQTRRTRRYFEYTRGEDLPGAIIVFDHNHAVSVVVFFPHQQTPEKSARLTGLSLSDLQFVSRTGWMLTMKGKSHGVVFKSVKFTNLTNQQSGSWNVIADFADQPSSKPVSKSIHQSRPI